MVAFDGNDEVWREKGVVEVVVADDEDDGKRDDVDDDWKIVVDGIEY